MSEDTPSGVGAFLREARERAGLSVRTIADRTKIPSATLEALERDELARLPSGIFLRAFIRSYAKEVGVDPEQAVKRLVARFPEAAIEETPTPYLANPEKIVVDAQPAAGRVWRIIGWSLPLLLVIVYFGFGGRLTWWRQPAAPAAARTEAPADSTAAGASPVLTTPAAPPATSAAAADPTAGAPTPPEPAADGGVPTGAQAGAPAATATPATGLPGGEPAARPAAAQPQGDSAGASPAAGRFELTLSSRGRCWVTVRSDGKIVYTGTMNPGERQDLKLGGQVSLTVGNAGAVDLALNGKPARSLGGEGEVKTLRLSADNLGAFLATR